MPGIFGLITQKPRQWAEPRLQQMLAKLRYNPSYVTGSWIDEPAGIYLGWAVLNTPGSGETLLKNKRGDRVLAFAGEEYPDPDVRSRLCSRGHSVSSEGADYLVYLSEEDAEFPRQLNGRFHGLLADSVRGRATLFNDRFGMHRLYYAESPDAFYFSAEAKAILEVMPELRTGDPRALGEFVSCGCVLENRTLFRGLFVLPPASAWSFRNGKLEQRATYFSPAEWENQEPLAPEAHYQELREVFARSLPRYFNGKADIGISLTGGLDTRMIMAWAKAPSGSLPCYTFGGSYRECQDVIIARRVAELCGQPFQVIPVQGEFLAQFSRYAEQTVYLSDGCAGVNRAPDLYANEHAARIAPVRITGNYGSEILRRLRAFKATTPSQELYCADLLSYAALARETYARNTEGHAVTFTAFRQAPWYQYGLLSVEHTQVTPRSPFLDNDIVKTAFRALDSSVPKNDIFEDNENCTRLIADGNPELSKLRTDRGLGGDSASWQKALHRALLEFTFRAEYAYDYGMPQWLARADHLLSPLHLERLFLGRHKFYHFRMWYRRELSRYVQEMLLDPRTLARPYLNRDGVEKMVARHIKGDRNYTSEIHRLLTLELQQRLFMDGN